MTTTVTIFDSALKSAQPVACRLLESAVARGKLANAYLLVGRAADDKQSLARQIACFFNCQSPLRWQYGSCLMQHPEKSEYCLNCQWISAGEHPQAWLQLSGEGKSQKIPVEKARNLTEELGKTSPFVRVVVVPASDEVTFHRPAANALLKSIEEPPADVVFFFFADSAEDVLATIVSRCQVIPLSRPVPLGMWNCDELSAAPQAVEIAAKLDAARAEFTQQARRYFVDKHGKPHYFQTVSDGLALSRRLQELSKELSEAVDEHAAAECALDMYVASEVEVLKNVALDDLRCTRYLNKLLELVERTKKQINQYVKPANAIESFGLSAVDLRQTYSGDASLAKR